MTLLTASSGLWPVTVQFCVKSKTAAWSEGTLIHFLFLVSENRIGSGRSLWTWGGFPSGFPSSSSRRQKCCLTALRKQRGNASQLHSTSSLLYIPAPHVFNAPPPTPLPRTHTHTHTLLIFRQNELNIFLLSRFQPLFLSLSVLSQWNQKSPALIEAGWQTWGWTFYWHMPRDHESGLTMIRTHGKHTGLSISESQTSLSKRHVSVISRLGHVTWHQITIVHSRKSFCVWVCEWLCGCVGVSLTQC